MYRAVCQIDMATNAALGKTLITVCMSLYHSLAVHNVNNTILLHPQPRGCSVYGGGLSPRDSSSKYTPSPHAPSPHAPSPHAPSHHAPSPHAMILYFHSFAERNIQKLTEEVEGFKRRERERERERCLWELRERQWREESEVQVSKSHLH